MGLTKTLKKFEGHLPSERNVIEGISFSPTVLHLSLIPLLRYVNFPLNSQKMVENVPHSLRINVFIPLTVKLLHVEC